MLLPCFNSSSRSGGPPLDNFCDDRHENSRQKTNFSDENSDDFGSDEKLMSSEVPSEKIVFCHCACVVANSHDDCHKNRRMEIGLYVHVESRQTSSFLELLSQDLKPRTCNM